MNKNLFNLILVILFILNDVFCQNHDGHNMPSVSTYENCKMIKDFAKLEWTITPQNISMNVAFEQGG